MTSLNYCCWSSLVYITCDTRSMVWLLHLIILRLAGISLTAEQWGSFKKNVSAIEKAIKKMEDRWSSRRRMVSYLILELEVELVVVLDSDISAYMSFCLLPSAIWLNSLCYILMYLVALLIQWTSSFCPTWSFVPLIQSLILQNMELSTFYILHFYHFKKLCKFLLKD